MKTSRDWLVRIIAPLLIATLMSPIAYAVPQAPTSDQHDESSPDKLPDSPGVAPNSNQQRSSQKPVSQSDSISTQLQSPPTVSTAQNQALSSSGTAAQQSGSHEPLGTAAAESIPTMGIAASQPAGAAVAPAKQRRVRTILIRVGAVVGVAAAVGATVALSEGSPSRPPGAR